MPPNIASPSPSPRPPAAPTRSPACSSRSTFDGLTPADLGDLVDGQTYVFLADTTTMTDPEHPLLAVDTSDEDARGDGDPVFRIAPIAMAEVEVNFFLSNVDFEDYASSVDDDGVFRGFDR
ncbi:DUF6924 domain-containing protein [Nocardia sp. NBC_00881]|uniref:DUF6924 domain-containing protein n=1 Tax=Nocardia sp. NBC_00881 TaxID=2975995 RepID=UPI00386E4B8B